MGQTNASSWQLIELQSMGDERGCLTALESEKNIPFAIQRVYYIYGTLPNIRRGLHAHRDLQQVAICVAGNCTFLLDDGYHRQEIVLDSPTKALYMNSMTWREMFDFSHDCVLMVLANHHYDESDYIRSYEDFRRLVYANYS